MLKEKSKLRLIVHGVLLVLLLYGLLRMFINSKTKFFELELIGFCVLLILSVVGFIGYSKAWGERVLFFTYLLYIVNLVLIWVHNGSMYIILLIIALLGFLLAIPKKNTTTKIESVSNEPHSMVFDEEPEEKEPELKAKHTPGKFLASKRSNVYHEPKCDWAKRIQSNRRMWFKDKEEAWEKGYKAHGCVK